ncbi:MAG: dienelactone hydrolase family protein [Nevskiaceae bacterium]|jgi:phospholipase/carboxylesterase|nr:dienelactone hydrolase family protein [Nevskiaceae bacterium]
MRTVKTEHEHGVTLAPADGEADAAVIWMHGLGADGHDFVPLVPELRLPSSSRIRFVFPHAPVRPVTVNAGHAMRAWYDIRSLTPEGRDDEEGLNASRARIESLIANECEKGIASQRIVLAGFSQGGAMALYVGVRHAQTLAGILALSCYLPLRERLVSEASTANRATPILMCHGTQDAVVAPAFGELSRDALAAAGYPVQWRTYAMGHSLCLEQIQHISAWLPARLPPSA